MKTVTTKTKAWITPHSSVSPQDLMAGKRLEDLIFHNNSMTVAGWTFAGDAEITVAIVDEKSLVENKVAALREEAKTIRAEATAKVTKIESQIQNLLAISFDGADAGDAILRARDGQ